MECLNEWLYECINDGMYECMNVWMYNCMYEWMSAFMYEFMNAWINANDMEWNECIDACMSKWLKCMNESMNE